MDENPTLFDATDAETEEQAWAEGEADADAGRVVPHEAVVAWLRSWGSDDELPPPACPAG